MPLGKLVSSILALFDGKELLQTEDSLIQCDIFDNCENIRHTD